MWCDVLLQLSSTLLNRNEKKNKFVYLYVNFGSFHSEKRVLMVTFHSGYIFVQTDKPIYKPGEIGKASGWAVHLCAVVLCAGGGCSMSLISDCWVALSLSFVSTASSSVPSLCVLAVLQGLQRLHQLRYWGEILDTLIHTPGWEVHFTWSVLHCLKQILKFVCEN